MDKFTPGEWKIDKRASGHIISSTGRAIASCMGYTKNDDNGEHVEENEANARLIVTAPRLLEVCRRLKHWVAPSDPDMDMINEVIKEATGGVTISD